jgi:hypothetical protein
MRVAEQVSDRRAEQRVTAGATMTAQQGDGSVVESDHPVAGFALGFADLDSGADLADLVRHGQVASLDVDVAPLQPGHLTPA